MGPMNLTASYWEVHMVWAQDCVTDVAIVIHAGVDLGSGTETSLSPAMVAVCRVG